MPCTAISNSHLEMLGTWPAPASAARAALGPCPLWPSRGHPTAAHCGWTWDVAGSETMVPYSGGKLTIEHWKMEPKASKASHPVGSTIQEMATAQTGCPEMVNCRNQWIEAPHLGLSEHFGYSQFQQMIIVFFGQFHCGSWVFPKIRYLPSHHSKMNLDNLESPISRTPLLLRGGKQM